MFYSKRIAGKTMRNMRIAVKFDGGIATHLDDKAQPLGTAKLLYNCTGQSGALRELSGIEPFELEKTVDGKTVGQAVEAPQGILKAWHFKRTDYENNAPDDRLVLFLEDMRLYEMSLAGPCQIKPISAEFNLAPDAANYKLGGDDVIMFSSPMDSLTVYDGKSEPRVIDTAPKIRSMCTHYERLFAVGQDNLLWFSDDLDPTNWNVSLDQAGYIEFADTKGKLLKVVSFMDYIYVFRQYGITRLTAYADQTEFYVNEIYSTGGIYPDSVAAAGDVIYFLSRDGLYSFDGLNTKKIFANLDGLFAKDNQNAVGSCVNNEYLLSCRMDFDDRGMLGRKTESANNAILKLDVTDGRAEIMRADGIVFLGAVMSDKISLPLICFDGEKSRRLGTVRGEGTFYGVPAAKAFLSPETDLGLGAEFKFLRGASVYTETDITLAVCFDGEWKYFEAKGKKTWQKIAVKGRGKLLRFGITSTSKTMLVRPIEITFAVS